MSKNNKPQPSKIIVFNIKKPTTTPLFNGNIAETFWRTRSDDIVRKYQYRYDHLNRLLNADYRKLSNNLLDNSYNESLTYDKNGNIKTLKRNGYEDVNPGMTAIEIDNLQYSYEPNGNKLLAVTDTSNSPQGFNDNDKKPH